MRLRPDRPRRPRGASLAAFLVTGLSGLTAAGAGCADEASCQARFAELSGQLDSNHGVLKTRQQTLHVLEGLRSGVVSGERVELPSFQRSYLQKASPVLGEVSLDARHRPASTNFSRHFAEMKTVAPGSSIRLHSFLPLKRSSSSSKGAPPALLVALDAESRLSVYSQDGEALLDTFDLGHAEGSTVTHVALSPSQDRHFVVSGDDRGTVRVHDLKVVAKREKKGKDDAEEGQGHAKAHQLLVSAHFSAEFEFSSGAAARKLRALLTVDHGENTLVLAGDSAGAISVFYRNGTARGTVRVTDDDGGVAGLVRVQGNAIVFFSAQSFGFFSPSHMELPAPACRAWTSKVVDVLLEPGTNRPLVALEDGDVLVFAPSADKQKACEVAFKFPRVSNTPFKLHVLKGHILGLPMAVARKEASSSELHFFHVAAMEQGYGGGPSRAIPLQVQFEGGNSPEAISLSAAADAASKSLMAVRFIGKPGLHLYEVTLKKPVIHRGSQGGFMEELADWLTWLPDWVPKVAVFGFALIAVVMWNMRKLNKGKQQKSKLDDFDSEQFKEILRERKLKKEAEKATAEAAGKASGDAS
eukprot:TRINITY_DN24331_c0_g1_i1.p1 TRINITY_DN24331_c0_g1~~TRINITY_DN24331_c0_g1_i1.p1  ORF type:complete len:584 (+),score=163.77 TRINITY_DN24331_c0_g1_i1:165-1916(+)